MKKQKKGYKKPWLCKKTAGYILLIYGIDVTGGDEQSYFDICVMCLRRMVRCKGSNGLPVRQFKAQGKLLKPVCI